MHKFIVKAALVAAIVTVAMFAIPSTVRAASSAFEDYPTGLAATTQTTYTVGNAYTMARPRLIRVEMVGAYPVTNSVSLYLTRGDTLAGTQLIGTITNSTTGFGVWTPNINPNGQPAAQMYIDLFPGDVLTYNSVNGVVTNAGFRQIFENRDRVPQN